MQGRGSGWQPQQAEVDDAKQRRHGLLGVLAAALAAMVALMISVPVAGASMIIVTTTGSYDFKQTALGAYDIPNSRSKSCWTVFTLVCRRAAHSVSGVTSAGSLVRARAIVIAKPAPTAWWPTNSRVDPVWTGGC